MMVVSLVFMYLAVAKGFEPLLLLPISFGMLLTNIPAANVFIEPVLGFDAEGHTVVKEIGGLMYYLYQGDHLGVFPPLMFLGIGAMTDFAPVIANPKSLILGGAAQLGVFLALWGALMLDEYVPGVHFSFAEAATIGIIGGADGPTTIYLAGKMAPNLMGPCAVAAYSYMSMVPIILPPVMELLTTKEERSIKMTQAKPVKKVTKVLFPVFITIIVSLIVPSCAALIGMLMLGNLFKESGVVDRLSDCAQNGLCNIVTIFLGTSVGASTQAATFLNTQTLSIFALGLVAFACATAGGVLMAKLMNLFLKNKINPLIGGAGVSAVPMAARVAQKVAQKACPGNFVLMHAMGPNVAGCIGTAVAAGILLTLNGVFLA
ncbi:MAG: sodium ion-translocating decarboxylase subunit beta [Firmicutes bacterium]|nr:sodium ion-translocating decarboxylase subunit beta [Bacillota bacterium]